MVQEQELDETITNLDNTDADIITPTLDHTDERWRLIRDVAVFQAKLFIDSIRDIILSPLSLMAALVGVLSKRGKSRKYYDQVMRLGERTEAWIDLFGRRHTNSSSLDKVFDRIENDIKARYQQGGFTKAVKDRVDDAIDGEGEEGQELG